MLQLEDHSPRRHLVNIRARGRGTQISEVFYFYHLRRCHAGELARADKFYRDTIQEDYSTPCFRTPRMDNGLEASALMLCWWKIFVGKKYLFFDLNYLQFANLFANISTKLKPKGIFFVAFFKKNYSRIILDLAFWAGNWNSKNWNSRSLPLILDLVNVNLFLKYYIFFVWSQFQQILLTNVRKKWRIT